MKFIIDLKIFIFLIIFFLTNQIKIYGCIMIFAIIHELGHLIMGLVVHMVPEKIRVNPMGISISFELQPEDYNDKIGKGTRLVLKKLIVALAGPFTNLLLICLILKLNISTEIKNIMIYSNILLIVFNMLPIYPLDGGRILDSIYILLKGKRKSQKYTIITSNVTLLIITAIASIAILYIKNIAILFIIIFLWYIVMKELKIYKLRTKIYKKLEIYDT